MLQYLFSFQPLWFFLLALLATWLMRQRSPNICYVLWIVFLIKLILPFGIYEGKIRFDFFHPKMFELSSSERDAAAYPPYARDLIADAPPASDNEIVVRRDRLNNRSPLFFYPSNAFSFSSETVLQVFLLSWVGLSLILLFVKSWMYFRFRKKVRSWLVVRKGALYEHFLYCAKQVDLRRIPILRIAPEGYSIPFAFGIAQKSLTVVIPQALVSSKNIKKLHVVLCHELVHIKKRDQYVNLIRFVGLICFHCHPLRLLADRFIQGFQEITTDLITISSLRVKKKDYVSILLSSFVELEKQRSAVAPLSVPFLEGDISVVRRLFFIKRFNPCYTPATRFITYFLSLVLIAVSFFNLSIYASYPFLSSLRISNNQSLYPFPLPTQTFPSILHDSVSVSKMYKDRLFVLEPRYGLFVYRFDLVDGPVFVSSYTMDRTGNDHVEWWKDCVFDSDYIYLNVEDKTNAYSKNNRIDILKIDNDFFIKKVGSIDGVLCSALKTNNHRLYVGGLDVKDDYYPFIDEGFLWVYDLTTPEAPLRLNSDFYDRMPSNIEINPLDQSMFVMVGEQLYYYPNRESLDSPEIVDLGLSTGFVKQIDPDTYMVFGQKWEYFQGPLQNYFLLVSRAYNHSFQVTDIVRLEGTDGNNSLGVDNMFVRNQMLFIDFPGHGLGVFRALNKSVEMLFFSPRNYSSVLEYRDRLVCLYPETNVFALNDFQQGANQILSWNEH